MVGTGVCFVVISLILWLGFSTIGILSLKVRWLVERHGQRCVAMGGPTKAAVCRGWVGAACPQQGMCAARAAGGGRGTREERARMAALPRPHKPHRSGLRMPAAGRLTMRCCPFPSLQDCLALGAVFSATDSVATLQASGCAVWRCGQVLRLSALLVPAGVGVVLLG